VKVNPHIRWSALWPFGMLLLVLVTFGFVTPWTVERLDSATMPVRILAATLILMPMGLVMGLPFPIGMRAASAHSNAPTVLLWGVNGATSVTASVLGVAIALGWGIAASFWTGAFFYAVAVAALIWSTQRRAGPTQAKL